MIVVVDAGSGNLRSVVSAFAAAGHYARVTSDPDTVRQATHVVVPGQGAFGTCMRSLENGGLLEAIVDVLRREVPYLGICLGLQILFESSDEGASTAGLGVLRGKVRRFFAGSVDDGAPRLKIPHMGWNSLDGVHTGGALDTLADGQRYYFVHSYYAEPLDPSVVAAWATHGVRFAAAVQVGRMQATQFHPEKSGRAGCRILDSFVRQKS